MEDKPDDGAAALRIGANANPQFITQPLAQVQAYAGGTMRCFSAVLPGKSLFKDTGQVAGIYSNPIILYAQNNLIALMSCIEFQYRPLSPVFDSILF